MSVQTSCTDFEESAIVTWSDNGKVVVVARVLSINPVVLSLQMGEGKKGTGEPITFREPKIYFENEPGLFLEGSWTGPTRAEPGTGQKLSDLKPF